MCDEEQGGKGGDPNGRFRNAASIPLAQLNPSTEWCICSMAATCLEVRSQASRSRPHVIEVLLT